MAASKALILSITVFFIGLCISPIKVVIDIPIMGVFIWLISAFSFYLGLITPELSSIKKFIPKYQRDKFNIELASRRINFISMIGLVLVLLDRYYFRGLSLSNNFIEGRELLELNQSTYLGGAGSIALSFGSLSLIMPIIRSHSNNKPSGLQWAISFFIFFSYQSTSLLVGSRSTLLVSCITTAVCYCITISQKDRYFNSFRLFTITLIFLTIAIVSIYLFSVRLEVMGIDPTASILDSAYSYTIKPSDSFLELLKNCPDYRDFLAGAISLLMYIYHGFFEFLLLTQSSLERHTYGAANFWIMIKFLNLFIDFHDSIDLSNLSGWREGIYTTFLGPWFLDYDLFMVPILYVIGFMLSLPLCRYDNADNSMISYKSILITICILFPVVNILNSSSGIFPFFASLFIPLLGKSRLRLETLNSNSVLPRKGGPV